MLEVIAGIYIPILCVLGRLLVMPLSWIAVMLKIAAEWTWKAFVAADDWLCRQINGAL